METIARKYTSEEIRDSKTGRWINSDVFREEAIKFMQNGYYCAAPEDTPEYNDYWDEQLRRCTEGFSVAGHKITGHHYGYLNFCQIEIVSGDEDDDNEDDITRKKETKNPDFWDGDFDYFWSLEIAKNGVSTKNALLTSELQKQVLKTLPKEERQKRHVEIVAELKMKVRPHPEYLNGGNHMIVGKSRRKGYSYKNGFICANIYNCIEKSLTLIGAFDKKYLYPKGTMGMASTYLSFFNKHTAWGKGREFVDKQEHKRASFQETLPSGVKAESGYMSEIIAISFGDNPEAARGKDAQIILFEESGVFPNLIESYKATMPGLTAGKYITGQMVVFGTGGDMASGTVDFAHMFYNPFEFGLMPFENIWDENGLESYCGFFHPVYMNMEGHYDNQGNSDIEGAMKEELDFREKLRKVSTSSSSLESRVQEYPLSPSEAFLTVSINDFPIVELRNQLNKVVRLNLHLKYGQPCTVFKDPETNKMVARPDMDGLLDPVWNYKPKNKGLDGGIVIYEYPVEKPPKGLYKMGFDPYRQASSQETHPSMACIYVYKAHHSLSLTKNTIVAQYVGRPYSPDTVNYHAEKLAELYNCEVMYENEVTHVKDYFTRRKKLNLLALQPDTVIASNVAVSKVKRTYGCHMIEKLKDAGEKYIKQWLMEERDFDEDGNPITNLEMIYDIGLLEELILYNRKGNFDRVMAFMMVMFQVAEDDSEKTYGEAKTSVTKEEMQELMNRMYRKN